MILKPKSSEISLPKGVTVVKESGIVYIKPPEGFNGEIRELVNVSKTEPAFNVVTPAPMSLTEEPTMTLNTSAQTGDGIYNFFYPVTGEGDYALPDGSIISCKILNEFDRSDIPEDPYTKWMDYAKMTDELCIRTRKSGDYLVINKNGNEGNLKNYMINEKIPKSERNFVPLLASGSKIYWVVGHRISEDVKVTEDTSMVIEFVYRKADEDLEETENG